MHISIRLSLTEDEYRRLLAEAQQLPGCDRLEPRELALVVQGLCKFYFDRGLELDRQPLLAGGDAGLAVAA